MYNKGLNPVTHFKQNKMIYLFMLILFLTGLVFGAIIINSMNFVQKQDLYFHLERYFNELMDGQVIPHKDIFKKSFFHHIKMLFILFFLGLSVIGLPLVWILIFIKGLVVGFSVGFVVNQLGLKGLILATLSIAPQNALIIPIYLIAGSFSMAFSLSLVHKLFSRSISQPFLKPFIQYSVVFIVLMTGALFGSLVESFVSNEAFKALLRYTSLSIINIL